ncbi:redoxin family protein [Planctomicrobium piriforme]|uniref:Peroxiredoxin n=1 Tax=Planctomicrobium piriforme TaxID=1576369 RepID=A0A1I3NIZ3_9PLAN|nr:redoxin family protein [Planctomicrobium piriforme]SFJ09139.1 Peroxiredoxin [Planctomicrobium piriforme]
MRAALSLALLLLCFACLPLAHAGEFNEVLSIGSIAPSWTDLPGTDGKSHSLADLAAKPVVVVIFTCVSCPTAADYEDRINALATTHGGDSSQVAVVTVCVNRVEADRLPALTARAAEKKFQFTYLYDESQKIARDFGAVFTPEFYVLDRDRKVIYMGAMDDNTDPAKVTQHYVDDAVAAALAGKSPETKEVIARGCRVRYVRQR